MNEVAKIFKALSDETRLRIIELLEHGELCVCDIVGALGMIQPKVSFHLGVLKNAGLLKDRKQGKWVHYSLDEVEMFKRLLLLSVAERVSGKDVEEDRTRLAVFLKGKAEGESIAPMVSRKRVCCKG